MSLVLCLALAVGVVAPGRALVQTRVTPAGEHPVEFRPGLDDTVINLVGRWGITVNLGDLDDDGRDEIVCRLSETAPNDLNISRLVVFDHDLTVAWQDTWGYSGNPEMPGVTIADIDNDRCADIIMTFAETFFPDPPNYKCRIYAFEGMTGEVKPGWPFIMPGWPEDPYAEAHSEAAAADLDGDDTAEIVVQVDDIGSIRKPGGGIYVLDHRGDSLWRDFFYADTLDRHGAFTSPAVADLDRDGRLEIVCHYARFEREWPYPLVERRLRVYNHDGTVRREWQTEGPGAGHSPDYGSPAVGDVDRDGAPEIVVVRRPGFLDVYDTTGVLLSGFPVDVTVDAGYHNNTFTRVFSSPCLADLDGDGTIEIVFGSSGREAGNRRWAGRIHAIRADGTPLTGFPVTTRNAIWTSPALGDLDGDSGLEVTAHGCDSTLYAVDADGDPLPGWPKTGFPTYFLPDSGSYAFLEGIIPLSRTPFLADIDADSLVELLVEDRDGRLHVFDTDGVPGPDRLPCPTFRRDPERTGWFSDITAGIGSEPARTVGRVAGPTIVRRGTGLDLSGIRPGQRVQLLDASGRLLRSGTSEFVLRTSHLGAGAYFLRSSDGAPLSRLVVVR